MAASIRHLVGREQEISALIDLLAATDDLPGLAVIVGEAGIGKTTVALAAIDAGNGRGYRVLSCRPAETDVRFSFAGLADLIGHVLPDVLPGLPRPQRRALENALAISGEERAPADEGVIAFAFLNALRYLAAGGPLLVAIDDVQWIDAPSLAIVRFALPRLNELPIAVVLTARDEVPPWLQRTVPPERLLTIKLGPLTVGALRALLRERGDTALPRPTLLRIWEASGGNPFLALELWSALNRRGGRVVPGDELPISANLEQLIEARLNNVGPDGLEVARVVAAGADPSMRLLSQVAGSRSERGLSAAVETQILEVEGDRVRFTHPLLRSAVWARTGTAQRRALHGSLAELVPDGEERVRHLALAAPGPERKVASIVEAAAKSALRRGANVAATELAELAVRLTPAPDVEDLRRRVLDYADRLCQAGDGREAIAILGRELESTPPGAARAAVLIRLARALDAFVGPREAAACYREALVEAKGNDSLEAEIHMSLADLVKAIEDRNLAMEHAELALEAASRVDDAKLRCRVLATFGYLHFRIGLGVPRERMDEALALERSVSETSPIYQATMTLAHQLVWSGELDRARAVLEELRDSLRAREDPDEESPLWYLSILEWRAGNWALAARRAADTLAVREQFGRVGGQTVAKLPAVLIAAHRGEIDQARALSQSALVEAEHDGIRIDQSAYRWVLGFIELSRGEHMKALEYLLPAWEIRDSVLILEPGHRLELADTLDALISAGRLDEAEQRVAPWEERAQTLDRAWALAITARTRALIHATRGDMAGAQSEFERALREHGRSQDPFQRARTLLALGATLRRAKQRAAARARLEEATAIFDRLPSPLWAAKARVELLRIGGRAPTPGHDLTEAERRVAELVANGRTNQEVAASLFIGERTVASHLTHIYGKLGVRSRTELARRLR